MKKFTKLSIFLIAYGLAVQTCAAPLSIEEQGSFAVGGSVKTSKGIYNPLPDTVKGKESNSFMDVYEASIQAGGQTLHGDHATVFYQIPSNPRKYPLVFCTVQGNQCEHGKPPRTAEKAFKISFYAGNFLFI